MEGQPGAGEQLDRAGEAAGDEWRLCQRGNSLHLLCAAAQWMVLLACCLYLGMQLLQPPQTQSDKVPWTLIRYSGRSSKGVAVNLSAELGSILIRNGSILIPCDGLYLVSLRSAIHPEQEEEEGLLLTLQGTHQTSSISLRVPSNDSTVDLTTVLFLFGQDGIALRTDTDANIWHLTLSLVLVGNNKC